MTAIDDEQYAELEVHERRITRLEERFPRPDTTPGGAQRVRIHVPSPDSLLTVGAPGHNASAGRAEGPGGIALFTVENFGAEIQGDTIFDTDGSTIVHSGDLTHVVSESDLVLSSNEHIRVGSVGDIDITAGEAGFTDPEFTVRPSMDVSDSPVVETGPPREPTEGAYSVWSPIWRVWGTVSAARSLAGFFGGSTTGVRTAAVARKAATALGLIRSATAVGNALWEAGVAAAAVFDDEPSAESSDPKLYMHGAGGVSITSPEKISLFSKQSVSIGGSYAASLKGGWKAALKAGGNAKVYGVVSAALASDGIVAVKGKVVGIKADYVESKAKRCASLKSEGGVLVEAKTTAVLNGDKTSVAGNEVNIAAEGALEIDSKIGSVLIKGNQQVNVEAPDVTLRATRTVRLEQGSSISVFLGNDQVEITAGGTRATVSSSEFSVHGLTVSRTETRIRGRCRIG